MDSRLVEIPIKTEHVDNLLKFMNIINPNFNKKYWEWKYKENVKGLVLLALDVSTGAIAGHYAVVKWKIRYKEENIDVVQSVDTLVNPDYRRMGIFVTLGKRTLENAQNHGAKLAFGFTAYERAAYKGFLNRIGWKNAGICSEYIYPLHPLKTAANVYKNFFLKIAVASGLMLIKLIKKHRSTESGYLTSENWNKEDFSNCYFNGVFKNKITSLRSELFFERRFQTNPNRKYIPISLTVKSQIVAYAILAIVDNIGYIVDLQTLNYGNNLRNLLSEIITYFNENTNVDTILIRVSEDKKLEKDLSKCGFIKRKGKQALIVYSLSDDVSTKKDFLNISKWYVSFTESDHV